MLCMQAKLLIELVVTKKYSKLIGDHEELK